MDTELTPTQLLFALIGAALHLSVGFLVLVSGLVMPYWAVAMLAVLWLSAGIWAAISWRSRLWTVLAAPVGIAALWILVALIGDRWLGWTA